MSVTAKFKIAAAGLALLALAACGTTYGRQEALTRVAAAFTPGKGQQEYQVSNADIQGALQRFNGPMLLARVPSRNSSAVLRRLATNGPYETFITGDKRTLILIDGILTGTRGLSQDIMDATDKDVRQLVYSRTDGVANRFRRYLDVENHTYEQSVTCYVERTGSEAVSGGVISAQTTVMSERCVNKDEEFTNTYWVDGNGIVLKSNQWVGPDNGYIEVQYLRR
ncbi:YjbF family lipoprotein [Pseudooceanicola nanhaiensis]|uniref:YjbF family lipoprotein n=1 Tax=Pseudooceanicola nanhaiensis TaxID=375761 RepID=UPI001CD51246|nr:YjbF family lipoprotein [Pseudooceanicola nanhaiensis]MCA0920386.1 YjbF family lipoprotein [Pseudooceanicola nanhaiensis]